MFSQDVDLPSVSDISDECIQIIQKRQWHQLYTDSITSDNKERAAMLLSSKSMYAGSVFQINNPFARTLASCNFLEVMRLRVLMHPLEMILSRYNNNRCTSCPNVHIENDNSAYHLMHCSTNEGQSNTRHRSIQNEIEAFLRKYIRDPNAIVINPPMDQIQHVDVAPTPRYADIFLNYQHGDVHIYKVIDFTISCMTSSTNIGHVNGSHMDDKFTMTESERKKFYKYHIFPNLLQSGAFLPFTLDCFGNIGPLADTFLTDFARIFNIGNGVIGTLKRKLATLTIKETTNCLINSRKCFINRPVRRLVR